MLETPFDIDDLEQLNRSAEGHNAQSMENDEGIVEVKKGVILNSNDAMIRLSGYRLEEVVDTIFASFFHLEDIPVVESICNLAALSSKRQDHKPVVRLIAKNGDPIPVEISIGSCGNERKPAHRIKIRHI